MKHLAFVTLLAAVLTLPALAQDTRSVVDHAGFSVEVPLAPQSVVSLSDFTTTIMAHELGLDMVATVGRPDGEGHMIRSGRELFGMEFSDDLQLASIHGELDIERIASFKPDLILGLRSDTIAFRDQLASIAPVLLFDIENGQDTMTNYADFASWIGKTEEFETLKADYDARIEAYKAADRADPGTYLVIRSNTSNGDITLYRDFGAITTVLDDIGFSQLPIIDQIPADEQRGNFSPEIIGEMNADYLLAGHMEDRGQTAATSLEELEAVAPGASSFLTSVQTGRFVSLSRFHVQPPAFAAMAYVLDHLELVE